MRELSRAKHRSLPESFELFYTRSSLRQPHVLLESHLKLRAAFLEQARIMPDPCVPTASLKRK